MVKMRAVPKSADLQAGRFFLWAPVVLACGIAAYFQLGIEPVDEVFYLCLMGIVGFGFLAKRGNAMLVNLAICLFLSGFVLAKARTEAVRAPAIERSMGPVLVRGQIEDADLAKRKQIRLVLSVREIAGLVPEARPQRLIMMVPGMEGLMPGVSIAVNAQLRPLLTPVAPGSYDGARAQWF